MIFWFLFRVVKISLINATYIKITRIYTYMKTTATQIETVATKNGMTVKTVINGIFSETERLAVNIASFKTAFFIMDNETFDFTFEKVYNVATDKTSYRLPKIFKA